MPLVTFIITNGVGYCQWSYKNFSRFTLVIYRPALVLDTIAIGLSQAEVGEGEAEAGKGEG